MGRDNGCCGARVCLFAPLVTYVLLPCVCVLLDCVVISCTGGPSIFTQSHEYFPLPGHPDLLDCMKQLPVCLHRSTLTRVRDNLNRRLHDRQPDIHGQHATHHLDPSPAPHPPTPPPIPVLITNTTTNVSSLAAPPFSSVTSPLSTSSTLTSFAVTYWQLTLEQRSVIPICQFCVWSSFIMSDAEERRRYVINVQSAAFLHTLRTTPLATLPPLLHSVSACPFPRVQSHLGHSGDWAKGSTAYFVQGEALIMEAICRATPYQQSDCLTAQCLRRGWTYPEHELRPVVRSVNGSANTTAAVLVSPAILAPRSILTWEYLDIFLWPQQHEYCLTGLMQYMQQFALWIQQHDPAPPQQRQRLCGLPPHPATLAR